MFNIYAIITIVFGVRTSCYEHTTIDGCEREAQVDTRPDTHTHKQVKPTSYLRIYICISFCCALLLYFTSDAKVPTRFFRDFLLVTDCIQSDPPSGQGCRTHNQRPCNEYMWTDNKQLWEHILSVVRGAERAVRRFVWLSSIPARHKTLSRSWWCYGAINLAETHKLNIKLPYLPITLYKSTEWIFQSYTQYIYWICLAQNFKHHNTNKTRTISITTL